jgi:hypothetical protein
MKSHMLHVKPIPFRHYHSHSFNIRKTLHVSFPCTGIKMTADEWSSLTTKPRLLIPIIANSSICRLPMLFPGQKHHYTTTF